MKLEEALKELESKYGLISDVIKRNKEIIPQGSCPTCTGAMFGTDYCSDCSGHCSGGGFMD